MSHSLSGPKPPRIGKTSVPLRVAEGPGKWDQAGRLYDRSPIRRSFWQLPAFVEQTSNQQIRNVGARLRLYDRVVAPKWRAVIAVVTAILDRQSRIQHHVLRRVEWIRIDQRGEALLGGETLCADRHRIFGPLHGKL